MPNTTPNPFGGRIPDEQLLIDFRLLFLATRSLDEATKLLEDNSDLSPDETSHFIYLVNLTYTYDILLDAYLQAKAAPSNNRLRISLTMKLKYYEELSRFQFRHPFDSALPVFCAHLNKLRGVVGITLAVISLFEHSSV